MYALEELTLFLISLTIPVVFKLSKRKVDENLQALHTILFGRKSNVNLLIKLSVLFAHANRFIAFYLFDLGKIFLPIPGTFFEEEYPSVLRFCVDREPGIAIYLLFILCGK